MPPVPEIYSTDYWSPLVTTLYLFSICALSCMLSKRLPMWGEWKGTSLARIAIVFVLADSFVFVFVAALLTLGIGTSRTAASCTVGVWMCISLYAFTKLFITFFLIERIHTVHGQLKPRMKSRLYLSNLGIASGWIVVFFIFIGMKNSGQIRESDGACIYHLDDRATFSTAGLDIFTDLYFSLIFAVPLLRGAFREHPRIRWVAVKSLCAAVASMCLSVTNLLIIAFLHGRELSWMCLALCSIDALGNASVLFFVTRSDNTNNQARPSVSELPTFLRGDSVFEEEPVSDEESRTVTRGRVPRCYGEEVVVPGPEKPQHSPPIEHPIPPAPHTRLKSPSRVFIQPRETVFGKTLPPPGLGFRGTQPRPSFAASQEPEPPSNPTEEDWEIEEEKGGTPSSQDRDRDEDDSWGREGWMG